MRTPRILAAWQRRDWARVGGLAATLTALHVVAFGLLFGAVGTHHYTIGTKAFGVGLGLTAYTFGLRHAFDADHIAAIDNTTRKLMNDGQRPLTVGFWFAMGHSLMVFVLSALVATGAHLVGTLTSDASSTHRTLGILGTGASGGFLYLIALLNIGALVGIVRLWRALRGGHHDEAELERLLGNRGLLARVLARATRAITRSWQLLPVGGLFGLGFDTATEVTLLVLAGSGAASGLPWYAIMVLPLLFAAGMSLLDSLDGVFMNVAYDWAFAQPVRKIYYNMCITGLSVAVALLIGSIELVGVLHDSVGWHGPVIDQIARVDLNNVGFAVVGLFVVVWAAAVAYWKLAHVEERWTPAD